MQQHLIDQFINIANTHGTPVYVYNAATITKQYQKLVNAFKQSDVKIFYACKALTNINILKHVANIGANIDCSSINEVSWHCMQVYHPIEFYTHLMALLLMKLWKQKT
jgi:diaminopimelate decarboxylase